MYTPWQAHPQSKQSWPRKLTFCWRSWCAYSTGVNVHFQNGMSERGIWEIQEQAQKQLLHARARWPELIHLALRPYAVRYAVNIHNTVPSHDIRCFRLELFAGIRKGTRMKEITPLAVKSIKSRSFPIAYSQHQPCINILTGQISSQYW